jgi:hypothetical protein
MATMNSEYISCIDFGWRMFAFLIKLLMAGNVQIYLSEVLPIVHMQHGPKDM